jgi:L-ascorbate metabolism protein UlaG (beta-lactamase superfamily)
MNDHGVTVTWLGHATVLIDFYGVRVLTDPTLFSRVGVDAWFATVGLRRLTSCAMSPSQLPPIDLVLISHAHFDHLDRRSLRKIPGRPAVITAGATSDLLPRRRFASVHEMRWGDEVRIGTPHGDIEVRAIEVKHWGARLGRDTHRGYNGYVLRREGRAILFGGDTAYTPVFSSHRRHGPYEAAIMPIGGYDPWIYNHCTPEQAVDMADAAGARLFVPIHHKTLRLSREPVHEPIERTEAALSAEADRLVVREVGDSARIV